MALLENKQRAPREPLYDTHPTTGAIIEVFYVDQSEATAFGLSGPGWVVELQSRAHTGRPATRTIWIDFAAYRHALCQVGSKASEQMRHLMSRSLGTGLGTVLVRELNSATTALLSYSIWRSERY